MTQWSAILIAFALFAQGATAPVTVAVRGRVTGVPAATAAGKQIVLNFNFGRDFGRQHASATIQPDGSFELSQVQRGTYVVAFTPPSDPLKRILVVGNIDLNGVEIPFVLPSFKVKGTVTGEAALRQQGKILPDEFVFIMPLNANMSGNQGGVEGYKGTDFGPPMPHPFVNADGTFEFSDVGPGTYHFSFGKNCKRPTCDDWAGNKGVVVTVTDSDVTGVTIPLQFY